MVRASSFFPILCLAAFGCIFFSSDVYGFQHGGMSRKMTLLRMSSLEGGADIDAEGGAATAVVSADAGSNPFMSARGKVNEIDFCIAPADVSLSRSYKDATTTITNASSETTTTTTTSTTAEAAATTTTATSTMSLTRFLNNASNRAVRRILLARSWPSPEALNRSLRQVMSQQKQQQQHQQLEEVEEEEEEDDDSKTTTKEQQQQEKKRRRRSLVPRPILKVIMRQRDKRVQKQQQEEDDEGIINEEEALDDNKEPPPPPLRTDDQYVADQLENFRSLYGNVAGFSMAEAYLECILSLATSGDESSRVSEVMEAGVYDESYRRVMGVLQSVGVELETVDDDNDKKEQPPPKKRIAPKLVDQDICWSMMDNIQLRKERGTNDDDDESPLNDDDNGGGGGRNNNDNNKDRLGGVLLSAEEPTMTRQLNVLSNIVLRALLFGGDQELLVLSETLEADKPAFVERWYPEDSSAAQDNNNNNDNDESRPGVQYLNCLVSVLQTCYQEGVLQSLDPPLALTRSYGNAYERLVASLIELGSGYIKPPVATVQSMPIPRTAQEELGRFAVWETTFRKQQVSDLTSFPEDMEGRWEVQDEIGGKTIGISTIALDPQGKVSVAPPMQGLSWRLDPGPTHLDTCTFQVLSKDDGTILQYRGFVDRGARLEARFSKRPIRIRGSVMFQMRDGDVATTGEYWKDMMLPINYRTGTTKFVMTKLVEQNA